MADRTTAIRLSKQDRGIVVFHLWQSLAYPARLLLSFSLILGGFALQLVSGLTAYEEALAVSGVVLILLGNLFLLVKGYDNRIDQGRLVPQDQWESVGIEKLRELVALDKQLSRWDRSLIDVTNPLGLVTFLVVLGIIGIIVVFLPGAPRVLAVDAAVLLVPHWVTGVRRLLRLPKLLVKARAMHEVLEMVQPHAQGWKVDVLMEIRGKETQLPVDIKFRMMPEAKGGEGREDGDDFLGLYGQCSTNDVQGTSYPYFYAVLVARKGFGLGELYKSYQKPRDTTVEFDTQGEVETLVIRQDTDIRNGYKTNEVAAVSIFQAGFNLAQQAVAAKRD